MNKEQFKGKKVKFHDFPFRGAVATVVNFRVDEEFDTYVSLKDEENIITEHILDNFVLSKPQIIHTFQEIVKTVFQILKDSNIKTKSEYITEREAILILPPCSLKNAFLFFNQNRIETAVQRDGKNVYLEIYAPQ